MMKKAIQGKSVRKKVKGLTIEDLVLHINVLGNKIDAQSKITNDLSDKLDAQNKKTDDLSDKLDAQNKKTDDLSDKLGVQGEKIDGLVLYLDRRFAKLETDMSEVKVEIKSLKSDVEILKKKIGSLEDILGAQSVTSLKSEIATCNTKINQLTVQNINLKSGYDTEIAQLKNDIILLKSKIGQQTTA